MSCLLTVLTVACVFDTEQVAVTLDLSHQVSGSTRYVGPDGRLEQWLGTVELSFGGDLTRRLALRYGLRHVSFIDTGADRGDERAFAQLVYHPFRYKEIEWLNRHADPEPSPGYMGGR